MSNSCSWAASDRGRPTRRATAAGRLGECAIARSSCGSTPTAGTVRFAMPVEEADQRPEHADEQAERAGQLQRRLLGMGDRPRLRGHLADDHVEEHHDRQSDRERDDVPRRVDDSENHSPSMPSMIPAIGRLGDGTETERAHRDAQLRTRQHQGDLAKPGERAAVRADRLRRRVARCAIGEMPAARTPQRRRTRSTRATRTRRSDARPVDLDPVGGGETIIARPRCSTDVVRT